MIDMETKKIYAVSDWNPSYHSTVSESDIKCHPSLEEFFNYLWDRLDQNVGYSLENA